MEPASIYIKGFSEDASGSLSSGTLSFELRCPIQHFATDIRSSNEHRWRQE